MKIQFEIKEDDAALLIQALERAASQATSTQSFNALQKVINEVKEDISNGVEAFQELKGNLTPFTDGSPILMNSNFRTQLGISTIFISSDNGLIMILNFVLRKLIGLHKPGATPLLIKKSKITTAKKIEDLVKLILENYESSN